VHGGSSLLSHHILIIFIPLNILSPDFGPFTPQYKILGNVLAPQAQLGESLEIRLSLGWRMEKDREREKIDWLEKFLVDLL